MKLLFDYMILPLNYLTYMIISISDMINVPAELDR